MKISQSREGEIGDMVAGLEDEEVREPQSGRFLCGWPVAPTRRTTREV